MTSIKTVGIVGTGLIGSGWASRCSARGLEVIAYDPAPNGEAILYSHVNNAWRALEKLGFDRTKAGRVRFTNDLEELCKLSQYIQESAPEVIGLKQSLHAQMDEFAAAEVVIASSSSGLLPTQIQSSAKNPERIVIGHPFNPVYILPLVEIVKGENSLESVAQQAAEFYRIIGMYPLMVRKEIDGYVSDRLQEALWREALHLVADGVASTDEVDDAIIYGPGLRWAIMGVCLTFHLAGGETGMKHMLEQFGPALQLPWTNLKAPELTDELTQRMVDGTLAQSEGRSVQELENLRDDCLIDILRVLQKYQHGAGLTNFENSIQ